MTLLRRLIQGGRSPAGGPEPPPTRTARAANDTASRKLIAEIWEDVGARRYAEALARLATAIAERPDDSALPLVRAAVLHASGRRREAYDLARRATAAYVPAPADHVLVGRIAFGAGDYAAAETWLHSGIATTTANVDACAGFAESLHAQGRIVDAIAAYRQALDLDPAGYDSLIGLGNCLRDVADLAGAEEMFRRAIAVDGDRAIGWRCLGVICDDADREAEAIAAHERGIEVEAASGRNDGAFLGLAASLRDAGRFDEALGVLEPNLQRLPGADAQLLYGHMLLAVGRLREGWHHSEFRLLTDHFLARRPSFSCPVWSGQDLRGNTILLRTEQGIGDTIQFVRYAALIKALGATVHIAVPPEFVGLAQRIAGVDRVFVLGQDEVTSEFDYHVPLLSLPRVFGTELSSIPAEVPYLYVRQDRALRWAARFARDGDALRVGLVWGGNPLNAEDRFRSLPLSLLTPLAGIPGVRYYALQKGHREHDADAPPTGFDLINLGRELADFEDTAAAISHLDLVISVCTSVAHLTGALGKPLWVMLHHAADWRWLTERSDSPWYPTARLFRQSRRGEWAEVVDRVRLALLEWAGNHSNTVARPPPAQIALPPSLASPRDGPGLRAGFSAVAETRTGIIEHLPDDRGAGESLAWYGEWLQQQIDRLSSMIQSGSTVIELGAGVGAHTLSLAHAVGNAGHVLAYESRSLQRRMLRLNLAANRATCVTVMRRQLGLRARSSAGGSRGSYAGEDFATETLDDLWLERLDWLKINENIAIEDVLIGAAATLWRLRPRLYVGSDSAQASANWVAALRAYGYRCWYCETPWYNPANFNKRLRNIFSGRTAHALLAIPEECDAEVSFSDFLEWT